MKIAVVGSRNFTDKHFIHITLPDYFSSPSREDVLISGGAKGVDTIAEEFIDSWKNANINIYGQSPDKFKITKKIFKPDWNKYGKSAGFIRNELIIKEADHIIAFWDGQSKGTKHSIDLAIKAGKPIDIYIRKIK